MKEVHLCLKNGEILHDAYIPPFDVFPDVILWEDKYFLLKTAHDELGVELGIYEICFAISIAYFNPTKAELSKDRSNTIYENIKAAISDESDEADMLPVDLEDAIDLLTTFYSEQIPHLADMEEQDFIAQTHHGVGQFIRNTWKLWWTERNNYGITEKPKLIEYFHSLGIVHGDDISGVILISWYRRMKNIDIDLPGQIEEYKNYWKRNGFSDGIPKNS